MRQIKLDDAPRDKTVLSVYPGPNSQVRRTFASVESSSWLLHCSECARIEMNILYIYIIYTHSINNIYNI